VEQATPLMLQTCVNGQPISKYFRGDSSADANRRALTVTRTKRTAFRRKSAEPGRTLATPAPSFHPARGLMIRMDWLRFFRAIVSGVIPSAKSIFLVKHDAVVHAAEPALILFSPRKSAIPRQLRIASWQTHSWKKRIIKLRKRTNARDETQTMSQRGK